MDVDYSFVISLYKETRCSERSQVTGDTTHDFKERHVFWYVVEQIVSPTKRNIMNAVTISFVDIRDFIL